MKNKISPIRKSNSERAQSLVEFAITLLLILIVMVMGAPDGVNPSQ